MDPNQISNLLRRIAQKIDNSERPDRALVINDLKSILARMEVPKESGGIVEVDLLVGYDDSDPNNKAFSSFTNNLDLHVQLTYDVSRFLQKELGEEFDDISQSNDKKVARVIKFKVNEDDVDEFIVETTNMLNGEFPWMNIEVPRDWNVK